MKFAIAIVSCIAAVNALSSIRPENFESTIVEQNFSIAGESDESTGSYTLGDTGFATSSYLVKRSGPTMTGTIPIYVIYYGSRFASGGSQYQYRTVLNAVLARTGASSSVNNNLYASGVNWWSVARSFASVGSPSFSTSNTKQTSYTAGQYISTNTVSNIVVQAMSSGLPKNANAQYLVIGDSGVSHSGYGSQWCGYHTYFTYFGQNYKFGYVGTGNSNCQMFCFNGPDGSLCPPMGGHIDGLVSIALHEITEMATDPLLNAWLGNDGYENADRCSWKVRRIDDVPNQPGKVYNLATGGYYLVVQQNYYQGSTSTSSCPSYSYSS